MSIWPIAVPIAYAVADAEHAELVDRSYAGWVLRQPIEHKLPAILGGDAPGWVGDQWQRLKLRGANNGFPGR